MTGGINIRNTVIQSLSAVGATQEAQFYAELFASQDPERFALIVLDPRCLKNPLLESLVSNLRILADLKLTPVLLVGALDSDTTSIKFQTQRLTKAIEAVGVRATRLNTASYGLIDEVRKRCHTQYIPVLEISDRPKSLNLEKIASALSPAKTIFLQPSGGLSRNGKRVPVISFDEIETLADSMTITPGQKLFLENAQALEKTGKAGGVFVIASPLNLLAELFTTKGSGTLLRRNITIKKISNFQSCDKLKLRKSMEAAFEKPLKEDYLSRPIHSGYLEKNYGGGAIFIELAGLKYLSKFWVSKEVRGEGIARDIWADAMKDVPDFFWRSRMGNPFNDWYMRACEGMQVSGDWRVFWKGLNAPEVPGAIIAAASAPDDFNT